MGYYEDILKQMYFDFEVGAKCAVEDGTDMSVKLQVIASELARLHEQIEYFDKQAFPHTADGIYLEKHGEARGVIKKTSSKATGSVLFTAKTPINTTITIPQGTLLASSKADDVSYKTTNTAYIKPPAASVAVDVESVMGGRNSTVGPQVIDILVTPIFGIKSVINGQKTVGGADCEPEAVYRKRVVDAYTMITNGCNFGFYEQLAKSFNSVWYAKGFFSATTPQKVEIFVDNYNRTISAAEIAEVQEFIATKRQSSTIVEVKKPVAKIINVTAGIKIFNSLNNYQIQTECEVEIKNHISELGIGESMTVASLSRRLLKIPGVADVVIAVPTATVNTIKEIPTIGNISVTCMAV